MNVVTGDQVYFDHREHGVLAGTVLGHGQDGCIISHEKGKDRIRWDQVRGHKKRIEYRLAVVDQGEDGFLAEDSRGKRHYIHGELPMQKAVPLLFFKAGPIANRAGLSLQDVTDRRGRPTRRWKRSGAAQPNAESRQHRDSEEERGSRHGYGTHHIEPGDQVHFRAGDFQGSGTVHTTGTHGATVRDSTGRSHAVHWHEVTGHEPARGTRQPEPSRTVRGPREAVAPEQFRAADWSKAHDDPAVTPDSILAEFPPDTSDKISEVQGRLASIEQTIDQYRKDGTYNEERLKKHDEIYARFFDPQKVAAAQPEAGQKPTFILLGGRGGSGKSWFKNKVYDPARCIVLDADEIKAMLPEYEGWNAHQVHEESSDILEKILERAREAGLNVVLDATMKTAKSAIQKVEGFQNFGYRIEAHYMHLPRQEAAKRAVARFLGKTRRFVPPAVVLSNTTNESSFDEIRKHADAWSFRDNNVEPGAPPITISEFGKALFGALKKALGKARIWLWRIMR